MTGSWIFDRGEDARNVLRKVQLCCVLEIVTGFPLGVFIFLDNAVADLRKKAQVENILKGPFFSGK